MSAFSRSLAIVIGINNYQNGINSLKTAVPDAAAIADLLKNKHGYELFPEVILDAAATCDRLTTLLKEELPSKVGKGDRLLFYFAGHGVALDGRDGPEGYLVPQNAKPGDKGSMLPMQMLHDALAALDCRHLLLILDCCFAGAFRWSANYRDVGLEEDLYEQQYQRFIKQSAWQIITSAGSNEQAIDVLALRDQRGQIGNHSPFAQVLLEALAGAADRYPAAKNGGTAGDGVITANELITYIESEFTERLQDQAINQTPGLWCFRKHANGRYIFDNPDHPHRALKDAPLLDKSTNPYRGLASFEKEHKDLFFGRRELTDILTEFVKQRALTVVLGTSGSGKSSLVKAGLIPNIEALQNGQRWAILPFRPEHSPFASLNQVLSERGLPPIKNPLQPDSPDPSLENALCDWLQAHPDMQLLVVIDQFEELVTLSGSNERQLFLEVLATAIEKYAKQLHLVITLRSDFEPQFKESPLVRLWNNSNFFVTTPMSRADLLRAIEKPAAKRTFFFESDDSENSLVDRLINEVEGMPGALPLLSFALSELYLKYLGRQEAARGGPPIDRAITEADYQALGSVQQSITTRADEIYNQLRQGNVSEAVLGKVRQKFRDSSHVEEKSVDRQVQQICQSGVSDRVIRNVMLRMVSTTGIARSRRPVQCSELEYPEPDCIQVAIVLETFEQERLLTTDKDAEGNAYIEPAHDALILNWSKINLWLNERQDMVKPKPQFALLPALQATLKLTTPVSQKNPDVASDLSSKPASLQSEDLLKINLELQRELTISANKWESARKGESEVKSQTQQNGEEQPKKAVDWLWDDDPRLPIIERVYRSTDTWLNKVEKEFVEESVLQKRRHRSRAQQIASAVILMTSTAAVIASIQWSNAQKQLVSTIGALTNNAQELFESNKEFDALLASLNAGKNFQQLAFGANPDLQMRIKDALQNPIIWMKERNRFEGHKGGVESVRFSPNGRVLASDSADGTIKFWDVLTGKVISTLDKNKIKINGFSFIKDGLLACDSADGTIKFWDVTTGEVISTLNKNEIGVKGVTFGSYGRIASRSAEDTIKLWDVTTGKLINTLKTGKHGKRSESIIFSPDGQRLASIIGQWEASPDGAIVTIWNVTTGKVSNTFKITSDGFIDSISFSPNGQLLASAGEDRTIHLWDVATGKEIKTFTGHTNRIRSVSFSPNGQMLASASWDKTIKLWDVATSEEIKTFTGHKTQLNSLSFSPNGNLLASGSLDGAIKIWDSFPQKEVIPLDTHLIGDGISISLNRKLLASTQKAYSNQENRIKLWDIATHKEIASLTGYGFWIRSVTFSPDGQWLASASWDRPIRLWDVRSCIKTTPCEASATLELKSSPYVESVSFSPNGKLLASAGNVGWGQNNDIQIWDVDTRPINPKPIKILQGHKDFIASVKFSLDGKLLASAASDHTIKIWDVNTGTEIKTLEGHRDRVREVSFSPDGKLLASASNDKTIKLWNIATGIEIKTFTEHTGSVSRIIFSPDGEWLVSSSDDNTIKLWDVATGKAITTFRGHNDIQNLSLSNDGQLLASQNSEQVLLWNVKVLSDLTLDDLMVRGCNWMRDYLQNNPNVSESDRHLCDGISAFKPDESSSVASSISTFLTLGRKPRRSLFTPRKPIALTKIILSKSALAIANPEILFANTKNEISLIENAIVDTENEDREHGKSEPKLRIHTLKYGKSDLVFDK